MKKQPEIKVDRVELKPFLGMAPGLYLTLLYLIVFLILLFLIGFLPGIIKGGKRVTFISATEPVVIEVDGNYVGSNSATTFLTTGEHTVTYFFEGVAQGEQTFKVGHPVFFTWLFPRKQIVKLNPLFNDISTFRKYLEVMYEEVVKWSAIIDFDDNYHRPPLFSQVATTATNLDFSGYEEVLTQFFLSSMVHTTSQVMLDDLNSSLEKLNLSNAPLKSSIAKVNELFGEGDGLNNRQVGYSKIGTPVETTLNGGVFDLRGYRYNSGLSVSETPISEYQYAHFVEANPYWSKGNLEKIVADGMADENYLKGVYPTTTLISNRPIRNISWYAAQAFSQWLSKESGKEVTLPTEEEWMGVAASVEGATYVKSLTQFNPQNRPFALLGGHWEFTSSIWEPLANIINYKEAWKTEANDYVIKGGSLIDNAATITLESAGVVSPLLCSDYLSFRVVWSN
jgi:iron(II)-dependent oxidoreductase